MKKPKINVLLIGNSNLYTLYVRQLHKGDDFSVTWKHSFAEAREFLKKKEGKDVQVVIAPLAWHGNEFPEEVTGEGLFTGAVIAKKLDELHPDLTFLLFSWARDNVPQNALARFGGKAKIMLIPNEIGVTPYDLHHRLEKIADGVPVCE